MGAISDGSFKKYGYGTGEGQVDLAKQMRLATQGQVTTGEMIARGLPSIFLTLASKIADGAESGKADANAADDATPEEIEAKRQEVLNELNNKNNEYQCDCVGDIDVLIADRNAKLNTANGEIAKATELIGKNISNIETLTAELKFLESNLNGASNQDYVAISEQIAEKEATLETLKKQNEELKTQKEKAQKEVTSLTAEISSLETSKKALANLDKQLERANKKDAVKKWDNNETQDIVSLIKKYNEYNAAGKTEKAEELKNGKLKEAIEAYQKAHKTGDNATIDNLIKMINNKK